MASVEAHLSLSIIRLLVFTVALVGNSLILFVILRSRRLRKCSSNILLAQLAFSGLFLGLSAGTRGTSNIIFAHLGSNTSYDKGLCFYLGLPTNFGIHISQTTVLAISLDRFTCVKFPILFRNTDSMKFSLIRFSICLTYSILGTGSGYVGVELDDEKIPICSSTLVLRPWYLTYSLFFSGVFSALILGKISGKQLLAFYAAIYILLRRKEHISFGNYQRRLFVTMTAVLISYILLFGLPTIIFTVAKYVGAPRQFTDFMGAAASFLSTVSAVANIFIYGWKHQEVRKLVKAVLGMKKVAVVWSAPRESKNTRTATKT
uniref:G_PROTEIN_RECEP_F1_2 domain-containing protein n=1 Tax=Steinernema glaseri TaxID=37863 RepID=A0A1I7ZWI9_9BILA